MMLRIKRILAFIIDWNLLLLPFEICFVSIAAVYARYEVNPAFVMLLFFMIPQSFAAIILRDVMFAGRSPGKRLFRLCVVQQGTCGTPAKPKLAVRCLFSLIYFIDGIVLLVSGKTIGDMITGCTVVSAKELSDIVVQAETVSDAIDLQITEENACDNDFYSSCYHTKPSKHPLKAVLIILSSVALFVCVLIVIIFAVLNGVKDNPEYLIAYDYLTESAFVNSLEAAESDISFRQYKFNGVFGEESPATARLGFVVKGHQLSVICHRENGIWSVCDECTLFE